MSSIRNILLNNCNLDECFKKSKEILSEPDNKIFGYSGFPVDESYFTKLKEENQNE